MYRNIGLTALISLLHNVALAQVAYPNLLKEDGSYLGPLRPTTALSGLCSFRQFPGSVTACSNSYNYYYPEFLNVQDFGNSIYNAAIAYTDSKIANTNGGVSQNSLSQQLVAVSYGFDNAIRRQNNFLSQGIAMVSAIEILPPIPGDRFSINVGSAGYNGQGAGSVSATVRVTDKILGYIGYARSLNQNLVKGGFSISIH